MLSDIRFLPKTNFWNLKSGTIHGTNKHHSSVSGNSSSNFCIAWVHGFWFLSNCEVHGFHRHGHSSSCTSITAKWITKFRDSGCIPFLFLKIAIQIRAWWSCKSSVLLVDSGISDWLYTTFLDRGTPKHPKLPTSEWLQNPVQKLIRCLNHVKHISWIKLWISGHAPGKASSTGGQSLISSGLRIKPSLQRGKGS